MKDPRLLVGYFFRSATQCHRMLIDGETKGGNNANLKEAYCCQATDLMGHVGECEGDGIRGQGGWV